jgi:hypothetical protein
MTIWQSVLNQSRTDWDNDDLEFEVIQRDQPTMADFLFQDWKVEYVVEVWEKLKNGEYRMIGHDEYDKSGDLLKETSYDDLTEEGE